ncbi:MAG: sigma-70 family RNA polymerase sigma factor [Deltaproteobacteria bacterium]|nr:sigma-70 family RNA polymerase sigma factor [Deltaproteobacteria bacterium]
MADDAERMWRQCVEALGSRANGLGGALDGLWQRGREAHGFDVTRSAFTGRLVAALSHRATADSEATGPVDPSRLFVEDLYLVAGILDDVGPAVTAARTRLRPDLDRVISRLVPAPERDDVSQRLEMHLYVGRSDRGPALAKYRASGSLEGWVRAVSTRFVVDDKRARARAPAQTEWHSRPADVPPSETDLNLAAHEHTQAIRDAMERAFAQMTVRDRNLLRYSVFHGLSVDELGALYSVHRSTAARWLQRARTALSDEIQDDFARHLGTSAQEAASLLRGLRSRLDVSIRSFLASTVEVEADLA